jgi:hypothetical protein
VKVNRDFISAQLLFTFINHTFRKLLRLCIKIFLKVKKPFNLLPYKKQGHAWALSGHQKTLGEKFVSASTKINGSPKHTEAATAFLK